MIVTTRYRDVDFEEVLKCVKGDTPQNRAAWAKMCGQPVRITAPPVSEAIAAAQYLVWKCRGPFYLTPALGPNSAICVHLAEIGD